MPSGLEPATRGMVTPERRFSARTGEANWAGSWAISSRLMSLGRRARTSATSAGCQVRRLQLLHEPPIAGEVHAHAPQLGDVLLKQPQARVLVMEAIPQSGRYGLEKIAELQVRDDVVVDFQQQPQPVTLAVQELLIGARVLKIQGILHGHRHVGGDRRHQLQILSVIILLVSRSKNQHSEPPSGRRKREEAHRPNPVRARRFDEIGKPGLFLGIVNDDRLLVFEDNRSLRTRIQEFPFQLRDLGDTLPSSACRRKTWRSASWRTTPRNSNFTTEGRNRARSSSTPFKSACEAIMSEARRSAS